MQNPFKVQSKTSRYVPVPIYEHFTLKERCTAKSTQALDAKYAACRIQFFGKTLQTLFGQINIWLLVQVKSEWKAAQQQEFSRRIKVDSQQS